MGEFGLSQNTHDKTDRGKFSNQLNTLPRIRPSKLFGTGWVTDLDEPHGECRGMKVAGVIIAGVVGFFSNFNRMFG